MKKFVIITIIFTLFSFNSFGQWTYVSSPGYLGGWGKLILFGKDTIYTKANDFFKKSFDGGNTWQTIQTPTPRINNSVYELDFFDINNGIISVGGSNSGAYKTNDGGNSWQLISTDFLRKIQCVTPSTFYADKSNYPANNEIIKTNDGGTTWSTILSNSSASTYNIHIFSEFSLYAFSNGNIYKTFDGGVTWDSVQIASNFAYSLEFTSINRGFYSDESMLYRTQNGGYTWDSIQFPDLIMDIHFIDDLHGVVACTTFVDDSSSIIARTVDGGNTWNFDQVNGHGGGWIEGICSVDMYDINYGFASGCFQRVYKLDFPLEVSEENKNDLFIYPNPAKDKLFVGVQQHKGKGDVEIFDLHSKIIYHESFSQIQNQMIDIANFSEGVYIIQVKSETGATTKKFVKR